MHAPSQQSPASRSVARSARRIATVAAAGGAAVLLTAGSASAEPSCAGQVFSAVATSEAGAVAERVAFIQNVIIPEVEPEGTTFGHVISRRLAQAPCE